MMKAHQTAVAALHLSEEHDSTPVDPSTLAHWTYGHRPDLDPLLLQPGKYILVIGKFQNLFKTYIIQHEINLTI
jgi:hypothetical protein